MAVIKATINLDLLNMGEEGEVDDALLNEPPLKGLIELGYLVVVKKADQDGEAPPLDPTAEAETHPATEETPQARRARTSKNTE